MPDSEGDSDGENVPVHNTEPESHSAAALVLSTSDNDLGPQNAASSTENVSGSETYQDPSGGEEDETDGSESGTSSEDVETEGHEGMGEDHEDMREVLEEMGEDQEEMGEDQEEIGGGQNCEGNSSGETDNSSDVGTDLDVGGSSSGGSVSDKLMQELTDEAEEPEMSSANQQEETDDAPADEAEELQKSCMSPNVVSSDDSGSCIDGDTRYDISAPSTLVAALNDLTNNTNRNEKRNAVTDTEQIINVTDISPIKSPDQSPKPTNCYRYESDVSEISDMTGDDNASNSNQASVNINQELHLMTSFENEVIDVTSLSPDSEHENPPQSAQNGSNIVLNNYSAGTIQNYTSDQSCETKQNLTIATPSPKDDDDSDSEMTSPSIDVTTVSPVEKKLAHRQRNTDFSVRVSEPTFTSCSYAAAIDRSGARSGQRVDSDVDVVTVDSDQDNTETAAASDQLPKQASGNKVMQSSVTDSTENISTTQQSEQKTCEKSPKSLTEKGQSPKAARQLGESSPDNTCSICLGQLDNKSFTDSCFHTFCFVCLMEWAKVKAVCPLCKQPFKSIIYNVRSYNDYDQHHLTPEETGAFGSQDGHRFRYRTTVTSFSWQRQSDRLFERPSRRSAPFASHSRFWSVGAIGGTSSAMRRRIYSQGQWVKEIHTSRGKPVRYRETAPEFFQRNPACIHRLVPWLNRELNVLLHGHMDHVLFVTDLVTSLVKRFPIQSPEFVEHLRPFLGNRTIHFTHELYWFARSPYDMATFDRHAVYGEMEPQLIENSSSSSDSDEIDVERSPSSPVHYQQGSRTERILMQPGVRRGLSTAADGWESPVPGPSGLSSLTTYARSPSPASDIEPAATPPHGFTREPPEQRPTQEDNSDEPIIVDSPSSDNNSDIVCVGYEKPWEERSPIMLSSSEDESKSKGKTPKGSKRKGDLTMILRKMKKESSQKKRKHSPPSRYSSEWQCQTSADGSSRSKKHHKSKHHKHKRRHTRHKSRSVSRTRETDVHVYVHSRERRHPRDRSADDEDDDTFEPHEKSHKHTKRRHHKSKNAKSSVSPSSDHSDRIDYSEKQVSHTVEPEFSSARSAELSEMSVSPANSGSHSPMDVSGSSSATQSSVLASIRESVNQCLADMQKITNGQRTRTDAVKIHAPVPVSGRLYSTVGSHAAQLSGRSKPRKPTSVVAKAAASIFGRKDIRASQKSGKSKSTTTTEPRQPVSSKMVTGYHHVNSVASMTLPGRQFLQPRSDSPDHDRAAFHRVDRNQERPKKHSTGHKSRHVDKPYRLSPRR